MLKHLVGFVIFSFVVGMSLFISGFFYEIPSSDSVYVYEKPETISGERSFYPRTFQRTESPYLKLNQAVFSWKTKQLDTSFEMKPEYADSKYVVVKLRFFAKGADEMRYLATEDITVMSDFDEYGVPVWNAVSSYLWLDNLRDSENLYVISDEDFEFQKGETGKIISSFIESKAFPVIISGKN